MSRSSPGCTGTECAGWGNALCEASGKVCYQSPEQPCILCVEDRTSSRSYGPISSRSHLSSSSVVLPTSCLGDECAFGGEAFCALNGESCSPIPDLPCIRCEAGSSSSGRSSSVRSDQCTTNEDCPEGYCENGICRPGCRTTEDCEEGVCLYGSCVPCFEDFECPGNRCENGQCLPCSDTLDCPSGFMCQNGVCTTPSSRSCADDATCLPDERCVGNVCLSSSEIARLPSYCGNARIDPGETCDDGSGNSDLPNVLCRLSCTPGRCGDGIVDTPLELCDDGNVFPGDGCSPQCQTERAAPLAEQTLPASIIELPFMPPSSYTVPSSTIAPQSPVPPGNADTGPAAVLVMISGAAAGWAWMRRKK